MQTTTRFSALLSALILPPLFLSAQIQLEQIVEVEAAAESVAAGGIDAPDHQDHGSGGDTLKTDRLHFLNQDRLGGSLMGIDVENGLVWRHPDAADAIRFGLENLKRIELKGTPEGRGLDKLTRITLTNGDRYRGTVLKMDADALVLDTPYAGKVSIKPAMIRSLRPDSESSSVYEGPSSIEEWVVNDQGNGGWEYRNQALYADNHNQVVGQDFETFPDMASIEFDLAWKGNPQLYIHFWSEATKNPGNEAYSLMIQSSYVRLYRNSNKRGRDDLGNTNVNQLRNRAEAHIRLLLNRPEKEVMFFLDGELVKTWRDAAKGDIDDDAFVLQSSGNSPMKISNIRIRAWDGKLEDAAQSGNETSDLLLLANGDKFSGTLMGIEAGTLNFRNDFAEFDIPLVRVDELRFAENTREEPRLREHDVVLRFPTEESVTLELSSLANGVFTGSSEAVGSISVSAAFLDEITLNPYDDRQGEGEEGLW